MKMPQVSFDNVVIDGGMDQVTPTLSLKNGAARYSINFEVGVNGGVTRVSGYERYSGKTSPSDSTTTRKVVSGISYTNTPSVGETITGDVSGETAVIAYIDGLRLTLTKISGDFSLELIKVGAIEIGTIDSLSAGPLTPKEDAVLKNAIADIYRADISAPTGSGPLRGAVMLDDIKYVFRNNAGSTACDIYKSSSSGWVNVPFYDSVSFTAGGAVVPDEGDTVTQGGVTATLKRAALTKGEFTDSDAEGQLIITTPAGGNFSAGAATVGATNVTLSGAESNITLLPNGRFEFIKTNFKGQVSTTRIYGCDGVNPAFEFDGDILVPIFTTADPETPKHIIKHRDFLFLSIRSEFFVSVAGEPYNFSGVEGAWNKATGRTITGFKVLPGDATGSALAVFNRSDLGILYGKTKTDFNFVQYNIGVGAVDYTLQNMTDTLAFDDRGLTSVRTSQSFGNFTQATITSNILPFINSKLGKAVASTLNRRKSQYRLFFDDGYAFYSTIVNGKPRGNMPVKFAHTVFCAFEDKLPTGEDVSFFGGTDGMLYQMDKGSSFDGENIDFSIILNYSSARTPRVKKRFRKASIEINAESSVYIEMAVGYILGYDSMEYTQPPSTNYDAFFSTSRWDAFTWDDFFWDARGLQPLEVGLGGSAENIALFINGSSDYVFPFTVNSIIYHYTPRRSMR